MTRWLWIWFILILSIPVVPRGGLPGASSRSTRGVAPAVATAAAESRWGGPLAEVIGGLDWVTGHQTSAAELEGKVVLVEFWAFECVNCKRSQPAMHALVKRYRESDVRVVSIHTPELPRERDPGNVTRAVTTAGIDYPVALDPEGKAWTAFQNRYWPCLYVLDGAGRVRYKHIGELHEGSPGWNDLTRRIDLVRAASKPAPSRQG